MSNADSNRDAARLLQALKSLVDATDPWLGDGAPALGAARKHARSVIQEFSVGPEPALHADSEAVAITTTHFARIVPPVGAGGITRTHGTQVWVGDTRLNGVTGITLRADLNDVWRATIECHVEPPAELLAAAVFEVRKPEVWWQRVLRWINGEPRNVTSLASTEMEWDR